MVKDAGDEEEVMRRRERESASKSALRCTDEELATKFAKSLIGGTQEGPRASPLQCRVHVGGTDWQKRGR